MPRRNNGPKVIPVSHLSEYEKGVLATAGEVEARVAAAGYCAKFRVVGLAPNPRLVVVCSVSGKTAARRNATERGTWYVLDNVFIGRDGVPVPCRDADTFVALTIEQCGHRNDPALHSVSRKSKKRGRSPEALRAEKKVAKNWSSYGSGCRVPGCEIPKPPPG